jgi:hypothetical protein
MDAYQDVLRRRLRRLRDLREVHLWQLNAAGRRLLDRAIAATEADLAGVS